MTHQPMSLDQVMLVISLSTYVVGALLLILYFFSRDQWQCNLAVPIIIVGCVCQFGQLVARYELTGVWPLLNLYGSLSLFSAMSVAIFIVFAFRYNLWFAGGFVIAIAAMFLAYGLTWNEGTLPAVPSLQSYWAKIHVPLVVSSYASFMVAFVMSGLYLLKFYVERGLGISEVNLQPAAAGAGSAGENALSSVAYAEATPVRRDTPNIASAAAAGNTLALWLNSLPTLAQLDIIVYRVIAVGLPLLTLGIITGAWWAKEAWGAYWQWDPKETAALLSWIVYAIYMHLHTRSFFRGYWSAVIGVFGFITIIFCYLGVNIWISGLHSYKM